MPVRSVCLAVLMLSVAACGEMKKEAPRAGPAGRVFRGDARKADDKPKGDDKPKDGQREAAADAAVEKDPGEKQPEAPRKIIYTGHIEVQVEDYAASMDKLDDLLKSAKGYLAGSEEYGSPGEPRRAEWTVRVPVDAANRFRAGVAKLGEVVRNTLRSEDVTDQYFDTAAALKNLETREQALQALYKKELAAGKLEDMLKVDDKLAQVRGEIDVRTGRIKRWDKLTAYTTITVMINERTRYTPAESPALGTRISRALAGSLDALGIVGQGLLIAVVAVAPWALVLAVVALPVVLSMRRRSEPEPLPPQSQPATLPLLDDLGDSPPTLPPPPK